MQGEMSGSEKKVNENSYDISSIKLVTKEFLEVSRCSILGDPGADSGGEGKSKRAGKYGTKKSKERARKAPGDKVLQQTINIIESFAFSPG